MTEEQIKQNAEAYAKNSPNRDAECVIEKKYAYLAGAHSRDEEITALNDLLDVYEQELDKLRNPWISVEDRLPEEFQMVIVRMQGGSVDSAIYTNGAFERNLQLKFGMKDNGCTVISWQQKFTSNITHWMPIPELKGGEE